jgi:replicative DNA helicase
MERARSIAHTYLTRLDQRSRGEYHHVPSGFRDLDEYLQGWLHEGHLIVVAARPGMGKTVFGQQVAENVAKIGKTAMFFTLEMGVGELMERSVARRTGIPLPKLMTGQVGDFGPVLAAADEIAALPLLIDDAEFELDAIINKARKEAAALESQGLPPLGVIVVDYLQLIVAQGANRSLEIGAVSAALKRLAKALKVPVVALSQLNRALENRQDKRPQLSDLRESGNIEQDADLVLFLYRDEYYYPDTPDPGVAEVIARKNRHGQGGVIKLAFLPERVMFAGRAKG